MIFSRYAEILHSFDGRRKSTIGREFVDYADMMSSISNNPEGATAQQQYDQIGEFYEGFKALPLARFAERDSVLRLVGNVEGMSVLDLACGTGFYTRLLRRQGAAHVLGVDISAEMVAAANASEQARPLGVRYEVRDAAALPRYERPFDAATAVYLLNYAEDEAAMRRMCRGVADNLAPGARFAVLTQEPGYRFDGPSMEKYGFRYEWLADDEIGPSARITALLERPVEFVTHYPRRAVYERCLRAEGFHDITWVPLTVSDEGTRWAREQGKPDFWHDFLANPPLTMLRCHTDYSFR